ncbi:PACE efflux transporter [Pelomonas sp. V22]|uniref:PACE efflux transporter n=1 Tax=Pelomonas sp. V22 TaxID=2822139 RepID=UPI0024A931DD|nr:PACE efflux transporter [Pelomonas sp. V22]MDI4632885.1 PACE efflux transporter [Pelomonas sp. V22]
MSPRRRRIVQALLYEFIAIAVVGPVLALVYGHSLGSSLSLAAVMSSVALAWNYAFNALFERWEARQATRGRSLGRRIAHGIGFEGGLVFWLVPVMAWWLSIGWWEALLADLALLLFFMVYTVLFTWAFDRLFGLPDSAR